MVEKMTEFEKERWEKSRNKSPQECSCYLDKLCCMDLDAARVWFCNNGHPCIKEKKNEVWEGCKNFEEKI